MQVIFYASKKSAFETRRIFDILKLVLYLHGGQILLPHKGEAMSKFDFFAFLVLLAVIIIAVKV